MRNLIRQPLVHFFVLGALLFVLFDVVNDDAGGAPGEIVVDANRIEALVSRFERTWQRPPSLEERKGLIDSWVQEEMLYREGLALGLDRDDPVVRRRMAQKVDFMIDSGSRAPDEDELAAWFEAHAENYRVPPRYAFEQVFFSPERHDDLAATVRQALAALDAGVEAPEGDAMLLPGRVELASVPQISRIFGSDFVAELEAQPVDRWAGPVRSSYGLHLVRIEQKMPAHLPPLDEVRSAVERDWLQSQSEQAKARFFQALRERYDVRIDTGAQVASATAAD
jgi:hypothetical protein